MAPDTDYKPKVTLEEFRLLMHDTGLSPRPHAISVTGAPGGGKTQVVIRTAAELATLIREYNYSQMQPAYSPGEEIHGVPVLDTATDVLRRRPLSTVQAWTKPGIVHLDEWSRVGTATQGAFLGGLSDGIIGDTQISPQALFVLTGNDGESMGSTPQIDTITARCLNLSLTPSREGIRAFMRGGHCAPIEQLTNPCDPALFWAERARLMAQWAEFSEGRPEMIAETPPRGFAESGVLWPSGRQIEYACDRVASRFARGLPTDDSLTLIHVSGCVGREIGVLWHRLRELLGKLPSKAEIAAHPDTVRVPENAEQAVSALGMLNTLPANDLWRWVGRWPDGLAELQAAAYKRNMGKVPDGTVKTAKDCYNRLSGKINKILSK